MNLAQWLPPPLAASAWTAPDGVTSRVEYDMDTGRFYCRLTYNGSSKVLLLPERKCAACVVNWLNDEAMDLLMSADYQPTPPTPLELAGQAFENAMDRIGGRG